jgi:hypothetical protein
MVNEEMSMLSPQGATLRMVDNHNYKRVIAIDTGNAVRRSIRYVYHYGTYCRRFLRGICAS